MRIEMTASLILPWKSDYKVLMSDEDGHLIAFKLPPVATRIDLTYALLAVVLSIQAQLRERDELLAVNSDSYDETVESYQTTIITDIAAIHFAASYAGAGRHPPPDAMSMLRAKVTSGQ